MTGGQGFNTIEQFVSRAGGVLLVDKPGGWTSFDVVKKIRGTLRVKKVGHAGTLDPIATGLLILCSAGRTKNADAFQALDKTYEGGMRLGAVTPSHDADTEEQDHKPTEHIVPEHVRDVVTGFIGTIMQLPPMYSAVKVKGQRLYVLARKGIEIERALRQVRILRFDILDFALPELRFRVECSKGTYVRTLVHDIGAALGCGAYMTGLRRTAIGAFRVDEAWTVESIVQMTQARNSRTGASEFGGERNPVA